MQIILHEQKYKPWNNLPASAVNALCVLLFEKRLERLWASEPAKIAAKSNYLEEIKIFNPRMCTLEVGDNQDLILEAEMPTNQK